MSGSVVFRARALFRKRALVRRGRVTGDEDRSVPDREGTRRRPGTHEGGQEERVVECLGRIVEDERVRRVRRRLLDRLQDAQVLVLGSCGWGTVERAGDSSADLQLVPQACKAHERCDEGNGERDGPRVSSLRRASTPSCQSTATVRRFSGDRNGCRPSSTSNGGGTRWWTSRRCWGRKLATAGERDRASR